MCSIENSDHIYTHTKKRQNPSTTSKMLINNIFFVECTQYLTESPGNDVAIVPNRIQIKCFPARYKSLLPLQFDTQYVIEVETS